MNHFAVAIDGPSGAGKSTLAKALAKRFHCCYVDTGAIYRTIAYHFAILGIGPKDKDNIRRFLPDAGIDIRYEDDGQHMYLNGTDVNLYLRTSEISQAASILSAEPLVREYLLEMQRRLAEKYSVVMDGRDIGTVVLPNAEVKIFLTADVVARASRRYAELLEKNEKISITQVQKDLEERDFRDSHREVAPLKAADDAIILDSTNLTIEETLEKAAEIVESRCK